MIRPKAIAYELNITYEQLMRLVHKGVLPPFQKVNSRCCGWDEETLNTVKLNFKRFERNRSVYSGASFAFA